MNTVIDDVSYLVSVCTVRCAPILPGVGGWVGTSPSAHI